MLAAGRLHSPQFVEQTFHLEPHKAANLFHNDRAITFRFSLLTSNGNGLAHTIGFAPQALNQRGRKKSSRRDVSPIDLGRRW